MLGKEIFFWYKDLILKKANAWDSTKSPSILKLSISKISFLINFFKFDTVVLFFLPPPDKIIIKSSSIFFLIFSLIVLAEKKFKLAKASSTERP